jgi:hypothetical protein
VMARPNPCAPPVTTAQRPFRSILFMVEVSFHLILMVRSAPLRASRTMKARGPSFETPRKRGSSG